MSVYIIAEAGQNHQGSMYFAGRLIERAAMPIFYDSKPVQGVDAIKFTKRDLSAEMTASKAAELYTGPHSFGRTYGEHRTALELTAEQHGELCAYARACGLDFIDTMCAIGALEVLNYCTPDYLKVASRDLDNLPLLRAIGETKLPVIISTGMSDEVDLCEAMNVLTGYHDNITILHCVSAYPTPYPDVNLQTIPWLMHRFPQYRIGFSDHTTGILAAPLAVISGAKVIEKHITIDRSMKGSDHQGSLGSEGLNRCVRDIRNAEAAMGWYGMKVEQSTEQFAAKLRRSIATKVHLNIGDVIGQDDVHLLSPGTGLRWRDRDKVIGKRAKRDIPANELVTEGDVE
jgi:sialic acid synthase